MASVRDMCAEDKCRAYQKNWICPPAIGTLEECEARMQRYSYGILLQTVGHLQKRIDSRTIRDTERRHMEYFRSFSDKVREVYPDALCLGAGGCRLCKACAFPDPCRFPEKALSSMKSHRYPATFLQLPLGDNEYTEEAFISRADSKSLPTLEIR